MLSELPGGWALSVGEFERVPFSERLRRSASRRMLLRTIIVALVPVAVAPVVLMVILFLGGVLVGGPLAGTPSGALVWATIVTVVIAVVSVALLIFGIIAVGTLHRLAHLPESERTNSGSKSRTDSGSNVRSTARVGSALLSALLALPRLVLAFLLTFVALVVVTVLALPATGAALIIAVVLFVRNARIRLPEATRFTPATRIALVAAIPIVPTLALLCLIPALLAATLDRPRSVNTLFRTAISGVQRRIIPLGIFILVSGTITAGLTWLGTTASRALDSASTNGANTSVAGASVAGVNIAGLLLLAGILAMVLAVTGAALAIIIAPTEGVSTAVGVRVRTARRPWRRTMPLTAAGGRVAMLVIIALIASIMPALSTTTPARAATTTTTTTAATATAPAPGSTPAATTPAATSPALATALIVPVLTLGLDAPSSTSPAPTLSADVTVPATVPAGDPTGTVQFFDGTKPLGKAVAIAPTYSPLAASAYLDLTNNPLDPGVHQLSFTFTPTSAAVSPGASNVQSWTVRADTVTTISTDANAAVNGPATITVTVTPTYLTSMKPDGTLDVTINGITETLPLVGGIVVKQVALLQSPDITAAYSGSALFNTAAVPATYTVGQVFVPVATQIDATIINPPFPLGKVINATADVTLDLTAPSAVYGTVVRGTIQVWAGPAQSSAQSPAPAQTLLVASSPLGQPLSIPTTSLHAGSTDIRFVFVPAVGFAPSEVTKTITIAKAGTTITAAVQPAVTSTPVPRGSTQAMNVNVTSDLDGIRTVQVFNTRTSTPTLVASGSATITGGHGTGSVDLTGQLPIGVYDLVVTVVGDADHVSATSASQTVSIGPGLTATTLAVSASPVEINTPVTLVATVTSPTGDTGLPGHVTFMLPDGLSQPVASPPVSLVNGTATYTYTPTTPSTTPVRAEYFDPTFQWEPSTSARVPLVVTMVSAAAPTVTWAGDLTPSDRTLTLTYAASTSAVTQNRSVPTGFCRIMDANGTVIASGTLLNGVLTVPVFVPGAHPVLSAQYVGDSVYGTRTDVLSVAVLKNYTPVIAVTSPVSVALGSPFPVTVDFSGVPLGEVTGVTVLAINAADNTVKNLGPVTLDLSGHGVINAMLLTAGRYGIRAVVSFTSLSELAPATSDPAVTTVQPVPVPQLSVSRTDPSATLVSGGTVDLTITAAVISGSETGLTAGTTVQLLDANDTVLGTTLLIGHNTVFARPNLLMSPSGLSGTVSITNLHGGPFRVHASVVYGPPDVTATALSPVFELTVPVPVTDLVVVAPAVTVGQDTTVTVYAYPSGNLQGTPRVLPATVTVSGVVYPLTVTFNDSGVNKAYIGTVTVPTQHAGTVAVTASLPGDGAYVSTATVSSTLTVDKRVTRIDLAQRGASAQAGADFTVYANVTQVGTQYSAAPTGTILLNDSYLTAGISCAADSGYTGPCTIPGASVRLGTNTIYASYPGDADNAPSSATFDFTATARFTNFAVTFSPTPDNWVYGQPITGTWTTYTSGGPSGTAPNGTVTFILPGGLSCSGPPAAGSCTLTPTSDAQTAPVATDYHVVFASNDDAPSQEVSGTAYAKLCVYPSITGTVDYSQSTRCGSNGLGVVTGGRLTVTGVPQARYKVNTWYLNGKPFGYGKTFTFDVTGFDQVYFDELYGPTCFTLSMSPSPYYPGFVGSYDPNSAGSVTAVTRPNCSDPFAATALELQNQEAGHPQYAAGTVVDVEVTPGPLTGQDATILDTLTGATPTSTNGFSQLAQVTMDADHSVTATFRAKACTIFDIPTTEGGGVTITAATRPRTTTQPLLPSSGACTDGGKAGYVPGTILAVTATANPDAAFDSWLPSVVGYGETNLLKAIALGTLPGARTATEYVTVPDAMGYRLAAHFVMVKCVSVTVISQAVRDRYAASTIVEPAGASWLLQSGPATTGCGGIASTTTTSNSSSGLYHIVTTTDSVLAAGVLIPHTTQPEYQIRAFYGALDMVKVIWSDNSPQSEDPIQAGASNSGESGRFTNLDQVNKSITITAHWVFENCSTPTVTLPQGGSYLITPMFADENGCEKEGELPRGVPGYLRPASIAGSPNLVPFTSGTGGTVSREELVYLDSHPDAQPGAATVWGGSNYRLEYCASIGVDVMVIDDAGGYSSMDTATAAEKVLDDGGCPPLFSRPGRTVTTSLTVAAQYKYSVKGSTDGTGPSQVIDAQGNISGRITLNLKINCTTLTLENALPASSGNCPGGASNRYLRGTTVQLQADGIDSDNLFEGWNGHTVDASQDQTAWVIMDKDRHAVVNIHHRDTAEKIRDGFSSLGQRLVAAVATVATGVTLAELLVAKVAAVGLKLAAAGLRAVGAGGAVADAIDKAGTVIQAQLDLLGLASKCLGDWANGSGASDVLTLPPASSTPSTSGTGTALSKDATPTQIFEAQKAYLAEMIADKTGFAGAVPIGSLLGDTGTFVNVVGKFGQNLSLYSQDAKTAWSSYSSSMDACMAKGVDKYAKDTYTGY